MRQFIGTEDLGNPKLTGHSVIFISFAMSLLILIADYFAGFFIQFPITYLIPVSFLSWYKNRRWGLALAIIMPLSHSSSILYFGQSPGTGK